MHSGATFERPRIAVVFILLRACGAWVVAIHPLSPLASALSPAAVPSLSTFGMLAFESGDATDIDCIADAGGRVGALFQICKGSALSEIDVIFAAGWYCNNPKTRLEIRAKKFAALEPTSVF